MASRGKYILGILERTEFTTEAIQQILARPLPPHDLAYPQLYYKPITRFAHERQGRYDEEWTPQHFPFNVLRLPRLPEIQDPEIRERVFTHLSVRLAEGRGGRGPSKKGMKMQKRQRWLESYKRYEGLGDILINHAAMLAVEKSRTKGLSPTRLLSNNTLSYLSYSYRLHHELRFFSRGMQTPPQKVFADIFEAYIGAVYVEAESRGEEQGVFDWLAELFDPRNWPEWPTQVGNSWSQRYANVDPVALHRMLRTIINKPVSRGIPINRLPRRRAIIVRDGTDAADAADAVPIADPTIVTKTTSGRIVGRKGRAKKANKVEVLVKKRIGASTMKANPYKALMVARRVARSLMLQEQQRLAGISPPPPPPPPTTSDPSSSASTRTKPPTKRKGAKKIAAARIRLAAESSGTSLVVVRAGPPALPATWLKAKMAKMRAANRK